MSDSLWPCGLQHTNLFCPSLSPGVCSNSCLLSRWLNYPFSVTPSLLPSVFPSISVCCNELVLCIRWSKYWSFSFSISPFSEHSGWFPLGWTGWISLQSKGLSRVFSNTTVQKHQFFSAQLSSIRMSIKTLSRLVHLYIFSLSFYPFYCIFNFVYVNSPFLSFRPTFLF